MDRPRYLEPAVRADLAAKMLFIAGPRQVGKTTLARRIMGSAAGIYLNWDNRGDRAEIRAARWPGGKALVVLDEIHKWRSWKSWLISAKVGWSWAMIRVQLIPIFFLTFTISREDIPGKS